MWQQNREGSKVIDKGKEWWFCALISVDTLRDSICWEQCVAFEVVCEQGTKAKNTILYKEKEKRKKRGGKKERFSSYLPGFCLLFLERASCSEVWKPLGQPSPALGGPGDAGGAVPVAAGRGAGCGAQPGLWGSRPRSRSAARSRGRAGGAWPSPRRAPPPRRTGDPLGLPHTCPRRHGAGSLPVGLSACCGIWRLPFWR